MELRHQIKTYITVNYKDLEAFITNSYGQEFKIVDCEEISNGAKLQFNVEKEALDKYDLDDIQNFINGGICRTRILLTDLCNKDLIQEGCYLIDIWW